MGMTIERANSILREDFEISKSLSSDCEYFKNKVINNDISYSSEEYLEATKMAIETMCKYQKIQEIYERFQKDGNYYHHMAWLDVMEVLKDGSY